MTEPKIARRCPTCHVTIRDQAFFCPQCGDKLDRPHPKPAKDSPEIHDTQEIHLTEEIHRKEQIHDTEEIVIDGGKTLTESDFRARAKETKAADKPGKLRVRPRVPGEVGSKIQRVTTKARDVEGDVKQRVQKFREMSSVVIDEASYDPSLRFILVAAALFVLFLVIVLLNKFIG